MHFLLRVIYIPFLDMTLTFTDKKCPFYFTHFIQLQPNLPHTSYYTHFVLPHVIHMQYGQFALMFQIHFWRKGISSYWTFKYHYTYMYLIKKYPTYIRQPEWNLVRCTWNICCNSNMLNLQYCCDDKLISFCFHLRRISGTGLLNIFANTFLCFFLWIC